MLLDPNEEVTALIVDDVESVGFGCEPLSYDQYKKVRIMGKGRKTRGWDEAGRKGVMSYV